MTLIEIEGFLKGKCLPGDLLVNETTVQYLHRKLNAAAELQRKVDAMATENTQLKLSREILAKNVLEACNVIFSAGYQNASLKRGMLKSTGNLNKYPAPIKAMVDEAVKELKTSDTDAALAGVQAQGVEMFAARMRKYADDEDSCNRKCSLNLTAERAESYSSWMRKESDK